jgi:hypothetical protein
MKFLGASVIVSVTLILAACCAPASAAPPYEGYTFCAGGSTGYLLDPSGGVVHTWHASGAAQTCAYLLEDGRALFPIQNNQCLFPHHDGAYPSGRFQKISWDGELLWDYRFCDETARAGYDVEPMPNGNILIPTDAVNVAKIFEVQPTGPTSGDIIWQCSLPGYLVGGNTYMNAVSYNPELDMILVDMQEPVRRVVVIDHSVPGGQVLHDYSVPGSGRVHAAIWVHRYFLGTDTVMPDADPVAMRLNNLLVVHNGGDRVVEFTWGTGSTSTIPFAFQDHEGSVQRLPNGNTLVTRGGSATIRELDDAGNVVASMTAPGSIQRAYRYGPTYAGLSNLWPVSDVSEQPSMTTSPSVRFAYDREMETGRVVFSGSEGTSITVRVFSLDGRMVHEGSAWGRMAAFSTKGLSSGVYYVQVPHTGGLYHTRFLKVR